MEKLYMADLVGIIGGSGLGDVLGEHITDRKSVDVDTPFGKTSGPILLGRLGANDIAFINRHGPGHLHSPSSVPYAANIYALKKLGVRAVIASAAVGSLKQEISPRELVIVDQVIDKTWRRQNSFFNDTTMVAHCELANPFCSRLRDILINQAAVIGGNTHNKGTYVCMEGPQFSTRAESLMHKAWGGDLIGMTASPEFKLAREAQLCYSLIAFVSDYDCWKDQAASGDKHALLKEIYGNLTAATENAIKLIKAVLDKKLNMCDVNCPCRKSLELAIWTQDSFISKADKDKLAILFK